jgi:hypothetical protein
MRDPRSGNPPAPAIDPELSISLGGPIYQRLVLDLLAEPAEQVAKKRILLLIAVTWLPLIALTAAANTLLPGTTQPFFRDVGINVRFLIALPLLVIAERSISRWIRLVLHEFRRSGLLLPEAVPKFDEAIGDLRRRRDSALAELLLLGLSIGTPIAAYFSGGLEARLETGADTWFGAQGVGVSAAGKWFFFVAAPIFQFHLYRWLYRLVIWALFLRRLSALELSLRPAHPDHAGGLGILSTCQQSFSVLFLAIGVVLSGALANQILHAGASVLQFKAIVGVYIGLAALIAFGPLMMFGKALVALKRLGMLAYSGASTRMLSQFDPAWTANWAAPPSRPEELDPSMVTDFAAIHANVLQLRAIPIEARSLISFVVAVALPFLPLLLTEMSLKELLKQLAGLLM